MGLSFSTWRAGGYANAAVPRPADPASLQQLGGQTMGTTWSLRFDNPQMLPLAQVREAVEAALARVIDQMSHWEPDSLISRFNTAPAGSRHALPAEFAQVMQCALSWAQASGGAIDPTVGALVARWGFGPAASQDNALPSPDALAAINSNVGWQRLTFDEANHTLLQPGGVQLDLSGIAKGFAVDHGVDALRALGLTDLLFEIGGELRGIGRRPVVGAGDEQGRDVALLREGQALVGAEHGQHGGECIRLHALRVQHGDAGQRMRHGLAVARIDGVRPAAAFDGAPMPAVARGGHGHVGQGDALRGRHLGVDLHLPRRAAGSPADAAQLAADLEQQVGETERAQRVDAVVDREALGDAGQVELHAAGL